MKKPTQKYDFSQTRLQPHKTEETEITWRTKRLLTGNAAEIIPIYYRELLPGDEITIDYTVLARQISVLTPTMDNIYADIFTFWLPLDYVLEDWKDFFANETGDFWRPPAKKRIPKVEYDASMNRKSRLMNFLGFKESYRKNLTRLFPTETSKETLLNVIYERAYRVIYRDYFRDQTVEQPEDISRKWTNDHITRDKLEVKTAYKYDDYFQSALNGQQVGNPISIAMNLEGKIEGIRAALIKAINVPAAAIQTPITNGDPDEELDQPIGWRNQESSGRNKLEIQGAGATVNIDLNPVVDAHGTQAKPVIDIDEEGLKVIIEDAAGLTIQQIREAATKQQLAELIAQGGSRYTEILSNIWGVKSEDTVQDRPQLIGHDHILLQQSQIANTNFSGANNDTAFLSAFGQTMGATKVAHKATQENSLFMSVMVIRNEQSYQNGVDQELTREYLEDYYNPMYEGISEQPIKKYEILATGNETQDNETFGFQEYGARYKTDYNQVFGNFESEDDEHLEQWHYADSYQVERDIILSPELLKASASNVDRTIPVAHTTGQDQFLMAIWPKVTIKRKMRTYSKPGIRKI